MIFAFDPFVGYFSGTLYDTVVDAGAPLLWYRVESTAFVCGVALPRVDPPAQAALPRPRDGADARLLDARRLRRALLFSALRRRCIAFGDRLGHWSTRARTIARDLGGSRDGKRCHVVFPVVDCATTRRALLVKDCDEEVAEVEQTLGAHGPSRITAFFFHDAQEKRR